MENWYLNGPTSDGTVVPIDFNFMCEAESLALINAPKIVCFRALQPPELLCGFSQRQVSLLFRLLPFVHD